MNTQMTPLCNTLDADHRQSLLLLLTVSMFLFSGCTSMGASDSSWRDRFHWPWSQNASSSGGGIDNRSQGNGGDPFLPPLQGGGQNSFGSGANPNSQDRVSLGTPQPVMDLAQTNSQAIQLVSATTTSAIAGLGDFCPDVQAIYQPTSQPRGYQHIVLHHSNSQTGSLQLIDQVHRKVIGRESCGYHFIIGNGRGSHDGEIEVSKRWKFQRNGAHLSSDAPSEYNLQGIGICLIGDFCNQTPTDRQVQATRALVRYLMATYDIPPYRVLTHDEVTADREHGDRCPGTQFRLNEILPERRRS